MLKTLFEYCSAAIICALNLRKLTTLINSPLLNGIEIKFFIPKMDLLVGISRKPREDLRTNAPHVSSVDFGGIQTKNGGPFYS